MKRLGLLLPRVVGRIWSHSLILYLTAFPRRIAWFGGFRYIRPRDSAKIMIRKFSITNGLSQEEHDRLASLAAAAQEAGSISSSQSGVESSSSAADSQTKRRRSRSGGGREERRLYTGGRVEPLRSSLVAEAERNGDNNEHEASDSESLQSADGRFSSLISHLSWGGE